MLSLERQPGGGGPPWLKQTAQCCATGTSPVCLYQLKPLWTPQSHPLRSQAQKFKWRRLSYKVVTDTECGAGAVISVKTSMFLDDLYPVEVTTCRSNLVQMLLLCMITESDVTEKKWSPGRRYSMCCYGRAPEDKVESTE